MCVTLRSSFCPLETRRIAASISAATLHGLVTPHLPWGRFLITIFLPIVYVLVTTSREETAPPNEATPRLIFGGILSSSEPNPSFLTATVAPVRRN